MTSSSAAARGNTFLANWARGGEDRVVAGRERDEERRERLGEAVRVSAIVGDADLGDAVEPGGGLRRRADILAGDRARRPAAPSSSAAVSARAVMSLSRPLATSARRSVVMFRSLPLRRAAWRRVRLRVFTFTPALRPLGSAVFSTLSRGVTSTP